MCFSSLRQGIGENFEPDLLLVAVAVGALEESTDLVFSSLDEAERDLTGDFAITQVASVCRTDTRAGVV